MASAAMLGFAILAQLVPTPIVRFFSTDPRAIAVGVEYLRIVAWNFVPSGIVFVSSSMFQAMGNTIPSLLTSSARIGLVAVPVLLLARLPTFELRWVWYISVASVVVQLALNLLLLRREFRLRLNWGQTPSTEQLNALSRSVEGV